MFTEHHWEEQMMELNRKFSIKGIGMSLFGYLPVKYHIQPFHRTVHRWFISQVKNSNTIEANLIHHIYHIFHRYTDTLQKLQKDFRSGTKMNIQLISGMVYLVSNIKLCNEIK